MFAPIPTLIWFLCVGGIAQICHAEKPLVGILKKTEESVEKLAAESAERLPTQSVRFSEKVSLSALEKINQFINSIVDTVTSFFFSTSKEAEAIEDPAKLRANIKSTLQAKINEQSAKGTLGIIEERLEGFKELENTWINLPYDPLWNELRKDPSIAKVCKGNPIAQNMLQNWTAVSSLINTENKAGKALVDQVNSVITQANNIKTAITTMSTSLVEGINADTNLKSLAGTLPEGSLENSITEAIEKYFNIKPELLNKISAIT